MRMNQLRLVGAVLLALTMAGFQAASTHAATIMTVSTCDESHFAAAISQANADNAGDTISFSCSGTITLTSMLSITGSMTINGGGQSVAIDGGGSTRLFSVAGTTLGLESVTLSDGSSSYGSAIYDNGGTVNILNTTFANNTATGGYGGALRIDGGTATVLDSTFSGNTVQNGMGGAIDNHAGHLTVNFDTFSSNSVDSGGGAIVNEGGGTMSVSDGSSFTGNSASGGYGGAIYSIGGTATVAHSSFSSNSALSGGAIDHTGIINVTDTLFSDNRASQFGGAIESEGPLTVAGNRFSSDSAQKGGAIYNSGATIHVANSTFLSNVAGDSGNNISGTGGAIYNLGAATITGTTFVLNSANGSGGATVNWVGGTMSVANSTFYDNSATGGGAAILALSSMNLTNSTVADNSDTVTGGAIDALIGTVSVGGSIVAGNGGNMYFGNCSASSGSISDTGYNLVDTDPQNKCGFSAASHDIVGQDPLLGSLTGNGGPTETIGLQPGSPAIDQIPANSSLCPATDQRGYTRPDDSGNETTCDMGAYEFEAPPPVQTALSQVSGSATYGGTTTLTATLRDAGGNLLGGEKIAFTYGNLPVCDVPGEPACPQTGTSGAGLGVATVSGVVIPDGPLIVHTDSGSIHASFDGDVGYDTSTSSGDLTIGTASSSTSASASGSTITLGQAFTVDYAVSSAWGILGDTTTGQVSVVKDSGPGNLDCSPLSTALSASQSNADGTGASNAGFDFVANSTTNSNDQFTCTPNAAGAYTYHLQFIDSDHNYTDSDSSTLSLTVNSVVATRVSAVSGSATYGGPATLTATLQDASNTGLNGKTITFSLLTASGWTALCGGSSQPACPTTQTTNGSDGVATLSGISLPSVYANVGSYPGAVDATFTGSTGYVASDKTGDLTVAKADQTLSFGTLANKTYGDADFTVSASATSGLMVGFGGSGNCSVTGNTVHLTGAGSCTITASQSGNDNYNAAPAVPHSFTIAKEGTSTSLGSSTNPSLVGQQVTYSATVSPVPDGGTVAFNDAGASIG
ncbi:MAG TPA: choice-of-anchor Q domain-containing protein, partial [Chloroflexota bacterium]